jgi:cysteinyl-tRNA synthetase
MLQLYNTRTRIVEEFAPLRGNEVRIYVCGITPSAEPHLGHARSFIFFDILRRYLKHLGYKVTHVQNITDIDDRSIERAQTEGLPQPEVVARYLNRFKDSMRRLSVTEPDIEPRATDYIPQIVAMIEQLVNSGHAYVAQDGIYFKVSSFPNYGRLSHKNIDELLIGARIAENEKKENPLDFALWKFEKPGEPSWPSTWGRGRPGWHIECSAMAHELLGEPLDIHGGGTDLIFPHHENEIAQSESLLPDTRMVNFWVHGGMLNFEERKMSKSLGNYQPLREVLDELGAANAIPSVRIFFLQAGYRKRLNLSGDALAAARFRFERMAAAYRSLRNPAEVRPVRSSELDQKTELALRKGLGLVQAVEKALNDDMNTSVALAELDDVLSSSAYIAGTDFRTAVLQQVDTVLEIFGLDLDRPDHQLTVDRDAVADRLRQILTGTLQLNGVTGEQVITEAIAARNEARRKRDFARADEIRDAFLAAGMELRDTLEGKTECVPAGA